MVQNGPARTRERSRMRKPARGWSIKHYLSAFFFLPLPERERVRVRVDLGHSSTFPNFPLSIRSFGRLRSPRQLYPETKYHKPLAGMRGQRLWLQHPRLAFAATA